MYTKLECVGRGGSSKVYKVMAPNRKIFALKRIRLQVCCCSLQGWRGGWLPAGRLPGCLAASLPIAGWLLLFPSWWAHILEEECVAAS